jgi:hypothetical protein
MNVKVSVPPQELRKLLASTRTLGQFEAATVLTLDSSERQDLAEFSDWHRFNDWNKEGGFGQWSDWGQWRS